MRSKGLSPVRAKWETVASQFRPYRALIARGISDPRALPASPPLPWAIAFRPFGASKSAGNVDPTTIGPLQPPLQPQRGEMVQRRATPWEIHAQQGFKPCKGEMGDRRVAISPLQGFDRERNLGSQGVAGFAAVALGYCISPLRGFKKRR